MLNSFLYTSILSFPLVAITFSHGNGRLKETFSINVYAGVSSKATGLNVCLSIQLFPHFVHASSEYSDESMRMRRLA